MMTLSIIVLIISVALALYSEHYLNGGSIFGEGKFNIGRLLTTTVFTWCMIMGGLELLAMRWLS